jgi:thiamine biosynthesis lipoprotein
MGSAETAEARADAAGAPGTYRRSAVAMDTLITLTVVGPGAGGAFAEGMERALSWFQHVERLCSRFEEGSEVRELAARAGVPVRVSPVLLAALRVALEVARMSGGAFDPTLGQTLEQRGFDRHYVTGRRVVTRLTPAGTPTYRDVHLDPERGTITLRQPLLLDLGAVAKGLAIDLAARELAALAPQGYAVDAGGDIYAWGANAEGGPWRVGVRHPRRPGALWSVLQVSGAAVCTSGDYARPRPLAADEHHLLDPRTGRSPRASASVTVVAPTAMLADALATAACLLGPERGLCLLRRVGVEGLLITSALSAHTTYGFSRYEGP